MFEARLLSQFSEVISSIYDAAGAPQRWSDVVGRIAALHGTEKALLFTPEVSPADGGFAFPHGIDEHFMLDWSTRFIGHDVWTQAAQRKGMASGDVVLDEELLPAPEFLSSVFYRDFLRHQDIRRLCSGLVFDGRDGLAPMMGCSIFGSDARGAFDEKNRQLHGLTMGHLSKALGAMMHLRDAQLQLAATIAALDRLHGGVLLLGARGQVVFANTAARAILETRDGLSLRAGRMGIDALGWMAPSFSSDEEGLKREIATCLARDPVRVRHFSQGVRLARPSGRRDLVLQISALAESNALAHADRHAHLVAFLTDPDKLCVLDDELLTRMYRTTPAETRLAAELLGGDGLPEIAERLGLAYGTVKKQLQGLFVKTRTSRQSDLVRLLIGLSRRG